MTAMKQLLDDLLTVRESCVDDIQKSTVSDIITLVEKSIPLEKQNIIDAFNTGELPFRQYIDGERYYANVYE